MKIAIELCFVLILSLVNCNDILINRIEKSSSCNPLSKSLSESFKSFQLKKGANFNIIRAFEVSNKNLLDDIISDLLLKVSHTNVITAEIEGQNELKPKSRVSVVIFFDSLNSFSSIYNKIETKKFQIGQFFTLVAIEKLERDELSSIFSSFWKNLIVNVDLIMNSDNGQIALWTYMPFNNKSCSDISPVSMNQFDINRTEWKHRQFHVSKTGNMYGCPIRIGLAAGSSEPYTMATFDSKGNVQVSGIEKDILEELSGIFNFRLIFSSHGTFPGYLFDNGTATGVSNPKFGS